MKAFNLKTDTILTAEESYNEPLVEHFL